MLTAATKGVRTGLGLSTTQKADFISGPTCRHDAKRRIRVDVKRSLRIGVRRRGGVSRRS